MQNLDGDVKQALKDCLNGDDATRKACIYKCFTEDAVFHHASCLAVGVHDIFGTYQLWKRNNITLDVHTHHIIANAEGTELMVDSHEFCWVWWVPFSLVLGGPKVYLHTLFKLRKTPEGYKFCYQSDHTMVTESLLQLQLPPFVDEFFQDYYRPFVGKVLSTLGGWFHQVLVSREHPGEELSSCAPVGKHSMAFNSYKADISRALTVGFTGNYKQRRQLVDSMYAPDACFWHPYFILHGTTDIKNYFQWWLTVNRDVNISISGIIPNEAGTEVMVDLDMRVRPWFWPKPLPPIVLFMHMILYLKDAPGGGKHIYRQEDHTLWLESFLFGNPLGRYWKQKARPVTGALFGAAGRALWELGNWWHEGKPHADFTARMRRTSAPKQHLNGKAA